MAAEFFRHGRKVVGWDSTVRLGEPSDWPSLPLGLGASPEKSSYTIKKSLCILHVSLRALCTGTYGWAKHAGVGWERRGLTGIFNNFTIRAAWVNLGLWARRPR